MTDKSKAGASCPNCNASALYYLSVDETHEIVPNHAGCRQCGLVYYFDDKIYPVGISFGAVDESPSV